MINPIDETPKKPLTEDTLMRLARSGIDRRLRDSGLTYSVADACRLEQFSEVNQCAIVWVNSGGNALAVEMAMLLSGFGLLSTSLPYTGHGCKIHVQW